MPQIKCNKCGHPPAEMVGDGDIFVCKDCHQNSYHRGHNDALYKVIRNIYKRIQVYETACQFGRITALKAVISDIELLLI